VTIRVLDLETTGTEATDEVVEIAAVDVSNDRHVTLATHALVKPIKPIPPAARAVHHISDDDVKDASAWGDVWPRFTNGQVVTHFCAHNAKFESQWITENMRGARPMICTYKAALRIWPDAPGHSNMVLRYWLDLLPGVNGEHHRAPFDALITAHLLLEILKHASIEQIVEWSKEQPLMPRCPIGKFRGKPWAEVERGFLTWMTNQADMDADLKWNARRELDHRDAPKPIEAPAEKPIERETVLVHLPGGREVIHLDVSPENATDEYVNMATRCLAVTASVADLDDWWRREAKHRAQWKIQKGDADYKILAQAFTEHKKKLLTAVAA